MKTIIAIFSIPALLLIPTLTTAGPLCSASWYHSIEKKIPTCDTQKHGPDVGSDEWKSVIEFKLSVRNKPGIPSRDSEEWCRYIDQLVEKSGATSVTRVNPDASDTAHGPSYDCVGVEAGSIEELICKDNGLSALDRTLSGIYAAAAAKAANEHPPTLKAEQRGWIKGRNDCWKSDDRKKCVQEQYRFRIAELQARYRLVPGTGPVRYMCEDNPANEVVVMFFQTDPATLIAEHGDRVSLMYIQPGGSGTRYQGRNETFWEHQGEALVTWGHGAPEMRCRKTPEGHMTKKLYINSIRVDCVGVGPQKCMQVKENPRDDWRLFYGNIENFTYEEGYMYEIIVDVSDVENPPADSSSKKYTLVKILSMDTL